MKKIMFTAIALVAFSGISMGNTIVSESTIEEVNVVAKKEIKRTCIDAALEYYAFLIDQDCGSPACGEEDLDLLNLLVSRCK